MNVYGFWDIFSRLFKAPPAPIQTNAGYAEQSARILETAYLPDIKLTESLNTESVNVPKSFIETVISREFPVFAPQNVIPDYHVAEVNEPALQKAAVIGNNANLLRYALPSPAILRRDNFPQAHLTDTGQTVLETAEKSGAKFYGSTAKAYENPAALLSEQPVKLDKTRLAFDTVYSEALKEGTAEAAPAALRVFVPDTAGEQTPRRVRDITRNFLPALTEGNFGTNHSADILTETNSALTDAAMLFEGKETALPSAGTEETDRSFNLPVSAVIAPTVDCGAARALYTAYFAFAKAGNGTLAFDGDTGGSGIVSGAGAVTDTELTAVNSTAYDPGYISAPKKELTGLREGAAAETERQADRQTEERIIREIRRGTANTLTALNAAADMDNIINALAEAFSQTAETGTEGIYR